MTPLSRRLVLLFSLAICTFAQAQNNRRGSCSTPNQAPGTCIPVQECDPLLTILRDQPISPQALQFLRQSQCSFQGRVPVVCCRNDRQQYPDHSNPWFVAPPTSPPARPPPPTPRPTPSVVPSRPVSGGGGGGGGGSVGGGGGSNVNADRHRNIGLLPTEDCGLDFSQRIFGGNITDLDEFPWTALLAYSSRAGKRSFKCGGVLISKRYVLTAAHCTPKANLGGNTLVGVRLGEFNTETDQDCEENLVTGTQVCSDPPQDYGIAEIIAHPLYNGKSANQHNDIALLRLDADVAFTSDYIKPICIPTSPEIVSKNYVGSSLTVAGWGKTETKSASPVKLKVGVPVVTNDECASKYASKNRQITPKQICAGGLKGFDSCTGDSGGPLMSGDRLTRNSQTSNRFHVTGIVSYGPSPCGEQGWPGVYTKVSEYREWILDQLKP